MKPDLVVLTASMLVNAGIFAGVSFLAAEPLGLSFGDGVLVACAAHLILANAQRNHA